MAKNQDDVVLHKVPNPKNKANNNSKTNLKSNNTSKKSGNNKVDTSKFDNQFKKNIKILAILIMVISFFILLSLISYSPSDEAFLNIKAKDLIGLLRDNESMISRTEATSNWLGLIGAFIANYLYNFTFGYAALILPIIFIYWGYELYKTQKISEKTLKYTMLSLILALVISGLLGTIYKLGWIPSLSKEFYGIVGNYISTILNGMIGGLGAIFIYLVILFLTIYFGFGYKFNHAKELMNKASEVDTAEIKNKMSYISSPYRKLRDFFSKDTVIEEDSNDNNPIKNEINNNDSIIDNEINDNSNLKNKDFDNINSSNSSIEDKYQRKIRNYNPNISTNISGNDNFAAKIVRQNLDFKRKDIDDDILLSDNNSESGFVGLRNNRNIGNQQISNDNEIIEENIDFEDQYENNNIQSDNEFQNIDENQQNESYYDSDVDLNKEIPAYTSEVVLDSKELESFNKPIILENEKVEINPINYVKSNQNAPITENNSKGLHIYVQDPLEIEEVKNIPTSPISVAILDQKINYNTPKINLLASSDENLQIDEEELKMNAKILQEKLETFNIAIENLEITPGPVVTQYEFVPAQGIKISRIESLSDDIAMALKARGIRIIAPIPGKGTVGLEIPNLKPIMVRFSSLLKSAKFYDNKFTLPIALGKTINGEVYISDLAKMPHLLIAGATGSGKSVGINTIISSLLFRLHPRDLKFVIIDPKKVELRQYEALENHFLAISPDIDEPIITDPADAVIILKALVAEMEKRYDILSVAKERNISDYNRKITEGNLRDSDKFLHRRMPYIVCIIDELADLMLTAKKEIENPIVRLTQLARAVGIHLIVATQRPSVDVITGLIKSNIPARASYLVASKIDSRTILDMGGADQLLGNGDMLFLPAGAPKPERIQNAFISSDEVEAICNFIGSQKGYSEPYYLPSVNEEIAEVEDIDKNDRDPLFADAARIVIDMQNASVSLVQRRLKVGYARAGRIIDQLEAAGIIGPYDGSKSRNVFLDSTSQLESIL